VEQFAGARRWQQRQDAAKLASFATSQLPTAATVLRKNVAYELQLNVRHLIQLESIWLHEFARAAQLGVDYIRKQRMAA